MSAGSFFCAVVTYDANAVNIFVSFMLDSGTSQSFFLGNLNKRAKVVVLQIKGLANQVSGNC